MAKVDHKPSQNERILKYMNDFGSITQYEAMQDLGVMRLASRISDLRRLGYPITSKMEPVRNRYGETGTNVNSYFICIYIDILYC